MGAVKLISSPDKLWELFTEYVNHERIHPMYKREYVGKEGREVDTPLETPITFEGFENWLADNNVIACGLGDYASNKGGAYEEFSTIITRIRNNCFVHNFKGASVGLFNPNLIARKLGLVEKMQTEIKEQILFPDVKE